MNGAESEGYTCISAESEVRLGELAVGTADPTLQGRGTALDERESVLMVQPRILLRTTRDCQRFENLGTVN